ncbi:MAG: UDP-glucose 4-epimerase, partial [Candidatus Krumholzibacteria bacterium]|nr:UDP-glucose 4-epimerase [Candidatus Krumholzibacteria bacterium]
DVIANVTGRTVDARYGESQKGDVMHTYADISAAETALGYRPTVALEDGIARETEWVEALLRRLDGRDTP